MPPALRTRARVCVNKTFWIYVIPLFSHQQPGLGDLNGYRPNTFEEFPFCVVLAYWVSEWHTLPGVNQLIGDADSIPENTCVGSIPKAAGMCVCVIQ